MVLQEYVGEMIAHRLVDLLGNLLNGLLRDLLARLRRLRTAAKEHHGRSVRRHSRPRGNASRGRDNKSIAPAGPPGSKVRA